MLNSNTRHHGIFFFVKESPRLQEWLIANGYPALFLLSFLASTLVPLGSEWLLAVLLQHGFAPVGVVTVATIGNTLGAVTTYAIGLWGGPYLIRGILRVSPESQQRAERQFRRYGSWALLFSWVPILGDPLCLVGGVLRTRIWTFLLLVACGKLLRYMVVAEAVRQGLATLAQ
jgi:membrane protein YqaA with SNARE-associated domain